MQSSQPPRRQDPDGLCQMLGISPDLLDAYSDADLDVILNGAARTMAKITHPDLSDQSEAQTTERNARLAAIHEARDKLLDKHFRRKYGVDG